ncbi:hypothetical protein CORC01_08402 [Colletotrichum orchidophilum]|uniref:Uncharacterized protein n=1 Tax=Colletotrichum orchidophilum TaxID=1209926 RepID=A0A1G4B4H5_9PEZI|nr:uncharacterized protein CORC01_08402 [Colletotrichum orchidophilum]OHE96330.1 hypothetical protein CORC01_08402 [Colletotrichum orchidophilum]
MSSTKHPQIQMVNERGGLRVGEAKVVVDVHTVSGAAVFGGAPGAGEAALPLVDCDDLSLGVVVAVAISLPYSTPEWLYFEQNELHFSTFMVSSAVAGPLNVH